MKKLIALVVACGLAPLATAQSTFHGDNARTGAYPGAGPVKFGGVKWTFKASGPIVGSAALAAGTVYFGDYGGRLHAIDQQTGTEKWHFKSSMPIASSPAVTEQSVFFVSSAGALVALDPATGKPRWVFVADYEKKFEARNLHGYPPAAQTIPDAWDLFISSPAVAQGKVFFGAGDGGVYAVDAQSGVLQWKFATGNVVHASPAVADGTVYIGSWDGNLYALDADSGKPKWVFKAGQDPAIHNQVGFQSSPAVVDGVVYVGCRDAHVYAIDANTGVKKWDYPTSKSWVNGTPAVRDGVVYVGTADSSRFMALDARTGRLRFNFDARSYVFSSAALAGNSAYFGSHNGRLYALDAKSGRLQWEFQTAAAQQNSGRILHEDGRLNQEAFAPVFGDFQDMYVDFYRYTQVGAIMASPVVDNGVVYIGSMDGNFYALQ
jgi:glucose dehydrogenase